MYVAFSQCATMNMVMEGSQSASWSKWKPSFQRKPRGNQVREGVLANSAMGAGNHGGSAPAARLLQSHGCQASHRSIHSLTAGSSKPSWRSPYVIPPSRQEGATTGRIDLLKAPTLRFTSSTAAKMVKVL